MSSESVFEKHVQTGIQIVLVALLIWMVGTTQQTSVDVARMTVQIELLQDSVKSLRAHEDEAYTQTDAARDISLIRRDLESLAKRLERLEEK